jgi:phosphoribosyl-AMP cyclohydrolase
MKNPTPSPTEPAKADLEEGVSLSPRYDAAGLITAIAQDAATGEILMLAHMNAEALRLTLETGIAHYWSRSRNALWRKGDTSGQLQTVLDLRVDCDQDAILMKVSVAGDGGACHTGRRSCFYRRVVTRDGARRLAFVDTADDTDGA